MKYLKYLSLFIAGVGLCFTSFSSAFNLTSDQISLLDQLALNSGSVNNLALPVLYEIPNPVNNDFKSLCVVFSGFSRSHDFSRIAVFQDTASYKSNGVFYGVPSPYALTCSTGWRKTFYLATSSSSNKFTIDRFWVLDSADLMSAFGSSSGGGEDCSILSGQLDTCNENYDYLYNDYNNLKSLYNTMSGSYNTCLNSLNSCQSDLTNCTNGNDVLYQQCVNDKENCLTSLSSLSGQYLSCVNYNSSLSDQLNECLQNSTNTGEELICNTYSLNWYNGNDTFSTQIHNNLWLPRGYKGYLDEGVLGVKEINTLENSLSVDDQEFNRVIEGFSVVMLFLFSSGLFLIFLFYVRKYFIGLKNK